MVDIKDYQSDERKVYSGPRVSRFLRWCFLLILVFVATAVSLYFILHLWKENERKSKQTKIINPELKIPGLINEDDKFHYESIAEEYLLDSTFENDLPLQEQEPNGRTDNLSQGTKIKYNENHHMDLLCVIETLKTMIDCNNRELKNEIFQHNGYWVLKNYFHAGHGEIDCHASVTYTTHGTFKNLESLAVLVKRWEAPVSVALYAPGKDFQLTIISVDYVLNCLAESPLLRLFVSFHIYFDYDRVPNFVWKYQHYNAQRHAGVNCSETPPYENVSFDEMHTTRQDLLYPVNVGRNIARDAAVTHFILDAEIDMYPSVELGRKFMEMVAVSKNVLRGTSPRVFALPVFGISTETDLPETITDLRKLTRKSNSCLLADDTCYKCNLPWNEFNQTNSSENDSLHVNNVVKRIGPYKNWQPLFIGTVDEPFHNERISREGGLDRNVQAYTLCVLDYEFHLLGNAFLIRRELPKRDSSPSNTQLLSLNNVKDRTETFLLRVLYPNLKKIYGLRRGCNILEKRRNLNSGAP